MNSEVCTIKYKTDNPGGDWLLGKQCDAMERYDLAGVGIGAKGLGGATTAWHEGHVMVEVAAIANLSGVRNEVREPGELQYENLSASVAALGWHDHQLNNSILIAVNHLGQAFLIEGNTRLAFAKRNGIKYLRAEIRWYNGGETAPGMFNLDTRSLPFVEDLERSSVAIF